MNYAETVNYLFNVTPVFEHIGAAAYKEGLDNTIALDNHFGNPHRKYKTIHIAGTNGKGSCSHTLASILQKEGYKVGLYTSPHLVDFRERIRVNGKCISEERVIKFVEEERHFFEPLHPSFFELTTALAFKYFEEQEVEIAIIEVGLGGRLDCTNIINPILSVITNISLDHTQFLGHTLAAIAGEKAGIIKSGVPVVIGETISETRPVFEQKAKEKGAPITFAEDDANREVLSCHSLEDGSIGYDTLHFGNLRGELGGEYQERNTNTILCAVRQLMRMGIIRHEESVRDGIANVCETTGLMGRWQKLQSSPLVICDTGHNAGGWTYLSQQIKRQHCDTCRIVFGMVDDKDIDTVMNMLPHTATYYFTQAQCKRAIPSDVVAEKASHHNLNGKSFATVAEAYEAALSDAHADDFVFVGGSSYIVADLLVYLKDKENKTEK